MSQSEMTCPQCRKKLPQVQDTPRQWVCKPCNILFTRHDILDALQYALEQGLEIKDSYDFAHSPPLALWGQGKRIDVTK